MKPGQYQALQHSLAVAFWWLLTLALMLGGVVLGTAIAGFL